VKLVFLVCFLLFFLIKGNAQIKDKSSIDELNQDSLNIALTESIKSVKTSKIFTLVGAGVGITGAILLIGDSVRRHNQGLESSPASEPSLGSYMTSIGIVTVALALPRWVRHSKHKMALEIELLKYNPIVSASINGVGLKIRF
jgi:uncharacterized membrane protein YidH (DUF202 family)